MNKNYFSRVFARLFYIIEQVTLGNNRQSFGCLYINPSYFVMASRRMGHRTIKPEPNTMTATFLIFMTLTTLFTGCGQKGDQQTHHKQGAQRLNHLKNETSPYLLQHADNPVDWYPWGNEALEKARREDKPILLSVGYSACHWCHVMEHESFENEEIARIMNREFVCIKVDREERPDIDQLYMRFVQMATGSGGWPMTVFLTPDQKPYFGGTYFPPEDRYGRPGFKRVLLMMADFYHHGKDKLTENLQQLDNAFARQLQAGMAHDLPDDRILEQAARSLSEMYEPRYGGIGRAPKFPAVQVLALFLRHFRNTGETHYLDMVTHTLTSMANGGIYDHLAGGFARYSTDDQWLVPHFEKMLYDNALLLPLYLDVYLVTGESFYLEIARDIARFVETEMMAPDGGFYSSLDADSEGEEGRFYVWSRAEIIEALGKEAGDVFCRYYGVTSMGNFEGRNILHVAQTVEQVARKTGLGESAVHEILEKGRRILLERRNQRVRPGRDDKILTSWNSLMLSALARLYQVTREAHYADLIRLNARFLMETMFRDGELLRTYKDGRAHIEAFAEDYAFTAAALMDAYEALFDENYLTQARLLTDYANSHFSAENGGYYTTSDTHEKLYQRLRDDADQSIPAATGVMLMNNLRLYAFTGEDSYQIRAEKILKGYARAMIDNPYGYASYLNAFDFYRTRPFEIVLFRPKNSTEIPFAQIVFGRYEPDKVVMLAEDGRPSRLAPEIITGRHTREGKPTAFVCRDHVCSLPVTDSRALLQLLKR